MSHASPTKPASRRSILGAAAPVALLLAAAAATACGTAADVEDDAGLGPTTDLTGDDGEDASTNPAPGKDSGDLPVLDGGPTKDASAQGDAGSKDAAPDGARDGGNRDAGVVDAGRDSSAPRDSGTPDATVPPRDAGNPVIDAGNPVIDAGNPVIDAGNPVIDAGNPVIDAGNPIIDAGNPVIDAGNPVIDAGGPTGPLIIGREGVALFDTLSAAQRAALRGRKVFFIHMSVGANITDGCDALGLPFEWAGAPTDYNLNRGVLGENLFGSFGAPNGNPIPKINAFQSFVGAPAAGGNLDAAGLKFGYLDIESTKNPAATRTAYQSMVSSLRGSYPGMQIYHVTPPLVGADGENGTRMDFGAWMKTTFGQTQVVFDLQDVESTLADGTRCTQAGTYTVCPAYRDSSDNITQGHFNTTGSERAAKAFLYALHKATTLP